MSRSFLITLVVLLGLLVNACAPAPTSAPAASNEQAATADAGGEDYTTPHPILSDLRVRQAIAHCLDRDALIAAIYPYVEDKSSLRMDSFLPKTHWAYQNPGLDYAFDPQQGMQLLDEAGWTMPEGSQPGDGSIRANGAGETLAIKFTATTAQFRQTYAAVAEQNLADCGIQLIRLHVPGSWLYGSTTGLQRRDFEMSGFGWVGAADPGGFTLYACNQIPLLSNNWTGQNYLGWCNQAASGGIVAANNTINRDERIAAYTTVQQEFAKDLASFPLFQRAEAEAWSNNLAGLVVDPTENGTASAAQWKLQDGGDTIIIGFSQEPSSMFSRVESASVQSQIAQMGIGVIATQYDYDYQPVLQDGLSTVESGLAQNAEVAVEAGDIVYNSDGLPVPLAQGVKVAVQGSPVEWDGSSPLTLPQLTVTYKLKPYTWSDGTPGSIDDIKLAFQINCDRALGAVTYADCDTWTTEANEMTNVSFGPGLEFTIKYWPGVQAPIYYLAPWSVAGATMQYPAHQVLSDGRRLAEVPAAEWPTLPEIAETPLSFGPFVITEWLKGQSITLDANPHYAGGTGAQRIVVLFVQDTNQAVAQLLAGDVDYLERVTLGAGAEVQTVVDASQEGQISVEILPSPSWEHLDFNLFTR